MSSSFGCQSMVTDIRFVLLKDPSVSHVDQVTIDSQWQTLHYPLRPDYTAVVEEFRSFTALLDRFEMEIGYLPHHAGTGLDSIYTHDPLVVSNRGAILCNMGKAERSREPDAMAEFLRGMSIPILGRIEGEGRLEGGDVLWLDERTVAVGEGYRSNGNGIAQMRNLLGGAVDEVVPVPLPHWNGPDECLHLLSFISPVDHDAAVVYSRLMPVPFRQYLLGRGMRLIEVPDAEYDQMACNVLAVSPGECIMLAGNPITQARLEAAGIRVAVFAGENLCLKGGGGPTCLTRPILRRQAETG